MKIHYLIIRRILQTIPVLLGVTFLAFSVSHSVPGDPARAMAGIYATTETVKPSDIAGGSIAPCLPSM